MPPDGPPKGPAAAPGLAEGGLSAGLSASLSASLSDWLSQRHGWLADLPVTPRIRHVGTVQETGDGVAQIAGLPATRLDELLQFADGTLGMAVQVTPDRVGCILLRADGGIAAGTEVRGTGEILQVPVGDGLLGRVVDPLGAPLDEGGPVAAAGYLPVDRPAPAIVDRELVGEPLMTGLTVVDAMVPLGRGQRELIIGDRKTGKTAVAVDAIINQRDTDVICVYAAVGQKSSSVAQVIEAVRSHGAPERCIFVVAAADATPGAQWIAPYAACSMAEHVRDRGGHALLVIDDLSKHAAAYRQLSLLLRRPPGREAYPGDIFYIHARLLERAARLSAARGGGSLTALPIAETQAGNLSAYIPTNLISITDGQIYLDTKLFYEGQKPAVNVGLSVSRVGARSQAPAMRALARQLRLDYAQFLELETFTRFGGALDRRTAATIAHGRRIRQVLQQPQFGPKPLAEQALLLLAAGEGRLDGLAPAAIDRFAAGLAARLDAAAPRLAARIAAEGALSDQDRAAALQLIDAFVAELAGPATAPEAGDGDR